MDTQSEGAETSSENGQQATSEETVHPDGAPSTDGDSSTTDAPTEEAPFHVEGEQIFKTKEDYVTHVNKQRGAASRLAHEKALAEQTAKHYETLYKAALDAVGKPAAQVAKEPEMTEETQAALKTLEAAGFIKADQMKAMLDEAIRPFRADSEQRFQEKVQEARTTVDNFIGLNPDAADHAVAIENTLLTMEKAGLPGGLDQAYYLLFRWTLISTRGYRSGTKGW